MLKSSLLKRLVVTAMRNIETSFFSPSLFVKRKVWDRELQTKWRPSDGTRSVITSSRSRSRGGDWRQRECCVTWWHHDCVIEERHVCAARQTANGRNFSQTTIRRRGERLKGSIFVEIQGNWLRRCLHGEEPALLVGLALPLQEGWI